MCCFMQISAEFNTTIKTVCNRCGIARGTINDTCLTLLGREDNATCTGTCGNQLAVAAAACTTTVSCKIAIFQLMC